MKRYFPLAFVALFFAYAALTGFQCGSAEATSAKLYMNQKQYDKAEDSFLREVTKNPKNEEAWFLLGQVRLELKKYPGVIEAYAKALEIAPTHKLEITRNRNVIWAMMYNEGVKNYQVGRDTASYYDKALDNFGTAILANSDSAGTYYVRSLVYFSKKSYDNATADLNTALQKKPDFVDAARLLGQIHYIKAEAATEMKDNSGAAAEYGKAVDAFQIAYKAQPSAIENITGLIDAYERAKQNDKAMELTRDAVAKEPGNKIFRYAYGVFLLKQEKYEGASEQFKAAIDIDPEYSDAVYNLGVSYLNWGVQMKSAADKAMEKAPKGKQPKEDLSYKEKYKLALPYLEKAAATRADDTLLWQQLARLYNTLGMSKEANAALAKFDALSKKK